MRKKKKRNKKNTGRAMLLPYWFFSVPVIETDIDLGNDAFKEYVRFILQRGATVSWRIPYNDC